MPFWKRTSPEELQRRAEAQQTAEASRKSLEAGRLPVQAMRRLSEESAADHPLFTSDLSSSELALTHNLGYQPLSQVMGSSIYHVGWQYTRTYARDTYATELGTLTHAHQHSASLALGRLAQEAAMLKAHAVVGVRFNTQAHAWGPHLLEYTAIGTAIRLPNTPLPPQPFISDLSGQEFWTLYQAGYAPVGVVTGFCSYYVALGSWVTAQFRSWYRGAANNQEVVPFSQGIYTARDLALNRVNARARQLKALGVVGMHIQCDRQIMEYELDNPQRYFMDMAVRFTIVGTAITARKADHVIPTPKPTLTFTDLRPGRYGESTELIFKG